MYYPLYVANKWVEPLDRYLNDASLTDPAWFKYDDILKAWRDADSVDGKPYGIPYDGEVTVQVYRKDLYAAKGLKPAETYEELVVQRARADRRAEPHLRAGAARLCRRRPEHVHLPVAAARLRRQLVRRQERRGQFAEGSRGAAVVCRHAGRVRVAGGAQLELARHRRRVLAGEPGLLHRRALVGGRHQQPGEVQGGRQGRLCALAQGTGRQARDVDLELGLPDQRGAERPAPRRPPGSSSPGQRRSRRRPAPRGSSPARPSAPA